jgi:hypothetical protein
MDEPSARPVCLSEQIAARAVIYIPLQDEREAAGTPPAAASRQFGDGMMILPFKRLAARTLPAEPQQDSVNPGDPVSLLMSHMDVLTRLRDYATVTHLLATQLLHMSAEAGLAINNVAEVYDLATNATRDAADAEAYRRALDPWLDELRDRSR